jgi:ankyrin repeat protein
MKLFRNAAIIVLALLVIAVALFRLTPADFKGHRLINAARDGDVLRVKLLLALGADINYSTGGGGALHAASSHGNSKLVRFLLDHGAKVDLRAKFGVTPLYEARFAKHSDVELLLLSHGANPDTSHIRPP